MEIQDFLTETTKKMIPLGELTTLAANRAAFGDDVIAGFRSQIELRSTQAQTVLDAATAAGRDTLLASEQRSYDASIRERDSILRLQQAIESRTEQRSFVPQSQTQTESTTDTRAADAGPVLAHDVRMATWLEKRSAAYTYRGERGAASMRLGAIVAALATGNRSALTELEQRALAEGSDATGGFLVPEVLASRFIDRMRDALVIQRAGAQVVPMSTETTNLARLAQPGITAAGSPAVNAAVGAWKIENAPIPESDLELERVQLKAKTLPLLLKMSVELFEDADNIADIVESEMAASSARELDRVALVGSGGMSPASPEPTGILNQEGVQLDGLGSPLPSNWDYLIDASGLLWGVNHEPNAAIFGVETAIAMAKLKSSADDQPLTIPTALSGVKQFRTNAANGYVFIGDFTQLLIGMRTSFRVEVSRVGAGAFRNLQIAIRSYLRADIALAHPEAFVVLS